MHLLVIEIYMMNNNYRNNDLAKRYRPHRTGFADLDNQ